MVDRYLIYFFILSFIGYIYECTAMIIWTGKWENRGFLFGPIIPIYGVGATLGTILFTNFIKDYTMFRVFLISMFASALLEYVVHYALEKAFNAYWWDYSKSPFNINGRICLPASIGFGIAGIIIIYVINPFLLPIIMNLNENLVQVLALFLTVLFSADITITISTLSSFMDKIISINRYIDEQMGEIVGNITDESKGINTRFYDAVDKIEEKTRFVKENRFSKVIMSNYKKTANKIIGFKGSDSQRLNYILNKIKDRIDIIRNR